MESHITLPLGPIRAYCLRYPIRRLSLFGSALRDDFSAASDIDLLVEYPPRVPVTLIDMAKQEIALESIPRCQDLSGGRPAAI